MLQADLVAADIPYAVEGPDGPLFADFHALRHSYVALLDRAGLTLKTVMQLARHSDPRLTMARYGRAQLRDLGSAVESLTPLLPGGVKREAAPAGQPGPVCTGFAQASDPGRDQLRPTETTGLSGADDVGSRNPLTDGEFEAARGAVRPDEVSAPHRTRTYNPLIKSQVTSPPAFR
jgi:hypothetical protein